MPDLIVAAATPLTDGGSRTDLEAIGPMAEYLERHGADGVFCCGTTGEGVLLSVEDRRAVASAFREALRTRLLVHCGAQTTADTVALAAHAADIGADGVGVIPPSYYALDDAALEEHLVAAAQACAPLPFFIYAFAARSGYPVPLDVVSRVRDRADNVAGMKCSDSPFDRVAPYLTLGLPVYVGSEPLLVEALRHGAAGVVSGIAAGLPDVVRAALDAPDTDAERRLREIRGGMERQPFIASVKHILRRRGVRVESVVRGPQRRLTDAETRRLDAWLEAAGLV